MRIVFLFLNFPIVPMKLSFSTQLVRKRETDSLQGSQLHTLHENKKRMKRMESELAAIMYSCVNTTLDMRIIVFRRENWQ